MKKITLLLLTCFLSIKSQAQKQSINTEVLSAIIAEKQKEVKKKVISNIVYKAGKEKIFINYATYNTFYYSVEALTTGINKQDVTKNLIKELSLYLVSNALTELFYIYHANHLGLATPLTYPLKLESDATPPIPDNLPDAIAFRHSSSDPILVNVTDKIERGVILDAIYETIFNKLKAQSNFDLVSDRSHINTGLDINFTLGRVMQTNLTNYLVNVNTFLDNLPVSGRAMTTFTAELENLKMNGAATSTLPLNDADIVDTFVDLGIITAGSNINVAMRDNIRRYLPLFAVLSQYKTFADLRNITPYQIELVKQGLKQIITILKSYRDITAITDIAEIIIDNLEIVNVNGGNTESTIPSRLKVNVEEIILALEEKFYNNRTVMKNTILWGLCGVKPDFSIGLNYLYFGRSSERQRDFTNQIAANTNVNYVGLASEKIGIKFMFFDKKYTHSFGTDEWFQYRGTRSYRKWEEPVSKNPVVTHGYVNAYFSGILYNIVDLKTDKEFNYSFFGVGGGITLFNNLDMNVSVAWLMEKEFMMLDQNNMFYSISFDIPIFEYIRAIKK